MEVVVDTLAGADAAAGVVEIVERKGLGHPDSICDAIAENLSRELSRQYRDQCGLVLHHNVDKVLLVGGAATPAFGGGRVDKPIEIFFAGRATDAYRGRAIPVARLARDGTRDWLRRNLSALDAERDVVVHCAIKPGSRDLVELFERAARSGVRLANDTSIGVGYAPLSTLESLVLAVEQRSTSAAFRAAHPAAGEDVKVMGVRERAALQLIVSCAFVGRHLESLADYVERKNAVAADLAAFARERVGRDVAIVVNAADDVASGSVYLTVTGTSAESGDDGEAGRGNRANGLITPYRPMTMESVAGKNPVTHVGKLYNVAAGQIAEQIVAEIPEIAAVECRLVSRIGRPIADPQSVEVRLRTHRGEPSAALRRATQRIVKARLGALDALCDGL
ncbi:MAG TPA: methionine adenosyltransferase, partial [Pseudomonadales bacterium]|nr:methionine adenosyltransferase [Pseudomonadales bacterium]